MVRKIQLVALFVVLNIISFGQNANESNHVVVHTVEKGQTVYSIAKLYLLEPEEIQRQNPSIDSSFAIKPGQILRIEIPENLLNQEALQELTRSSQTHEIEKEETLYSIARQYHTSVEKLREWNNLSSNNIQVGSELIVGWQYANRTTSRTQISQGRPADSLVAPSRKFPSKQEKVVKKPATDSTQKNRDDDFSVKRYYSNNKQDILKERFLSDSSMKEPQIKEGAAIWFSTDNKMMTTSYYGLFSEVPVGNIVKVTNLLNDRVAYVKIIGRLPNTAENHGAMIKLTPAVRDLLRTSDGKIRVKVAYGE